MLDSLFNKVVGLLPAFGLNTSTSLYSVLMRGKKWKKNCGSCSLWLRLLIAIMQRCTEQCALHLYCTSLIYVHSKSKVTENIFNLQEWHQNTKTFISYKTFTVGKKLKPAKNNQIRLVVAWYRFFIREPSFQDDHFWAVWSVVVLYRFDCITGRNQKLKSLWKHKNICTMA